MSDESVDANRSQGALRGMCSGQRMLSSKEIDLPGLLRILNLFCSKKAALISSKFIVLDTHSESQIVAQKLLRLQHTQRHYRISKLGAFRLDTKWGIAKIRMSSSHFKTLQKFTPGSLYQPQESRSPVRSSWPRPSIAFSNLLVRSCRGAQAAIQRRVHEVIAVACRCIYAIAWALIARLSNDEGAIPAFENGSKGSRVFLMFPECLGF